MRIGPHDTLDKGTKVRVGDKRGFVVSYEVVPASNGGMITVHTIRLTEAYSRSSRPRGWKPIEAKDWTGNYSFVEVDEKKRTERNRGGA